jgi:hypothetical protein
MKRSFRVVRSCAWEAVRDFRWHEYAPFGWILAAELVFLALAMNLGTGLGMATAGGIARLVGAEKQIHFPVFFLYLPLLGSMVEAFLYAAPGSVLIPLALIRIMAPMDHALASGAGVMPRLKQALGPTLTVSLLNLALLSGWQWFLNAGPGSLARSALPGFQGIAVTWGISLLGAFTIAALFIYVPVVAIRPGVRYIQAIRLGVREGRRLLLYTLFLVLLFSLPALPVLMMLQLKTALLVEKLRPEVVGYGLGLYMILISVGTYLTYAAAARLHWAGEEEGA